jgi:hypothetical protein
MKLGFVQQSLFLSGFSFDLIHFPWHNGAAKPKNLVAWPGTPWPSQRQFKSLLRAAVSQSTQTVLPAHIIIINILSTYTHDYLVQSKHL